VEGAEGDTGDKGDKGLPSKAGDTGDKDSKDDKGGKSKEDGEHKTFTQTELDNIIQNRLERAMKKAEDERKQAEELAKLSEKERAKREIEIKEQELLDERNKFYKERLELQTSKELDAIDIPIAFTEFVMAEDAEATQARIKKFVDLWESEVEKRRIESMRGQAPQKGTTDTGGSKSISIMELAEKANIRK
jgi:hypothetical protein